MPNLETGNLTRRSLGGVALGLTVAGILAGRTAGADQGKKPFARTAMAWSPTDASTQEISM